MRPEDWPFISVVEVSGDLDKSSFSDLMGAEVGMESTENRIGEEEVETPSVDSCFEDSFS